MHEILFTITIFYYYFYFYSELAELNGRVQNIRENIKFLRSEVAEKNAIIKQNEKLKKELIPIQKKLKNLYNNNITLCHKLLNEGLEISKKERAFQSTLIAQQIDGIGENLSYNQIPVKSPLHSPIQSANNSINGSILDDDIFPHLYTNSNTYNNSSEYYDNNDNHSELSGNSFRSGTDIHGNHRNLSEQGIPRIYSTTGTGHHITTTATTSAFDSISSYNDPKQSIYLNPNDIWKAPIKPVYINTIPTEHQPQINQNIIRKRLKELQELRKYEDTNYSNTVNKNKNIPVETAIEETTTAVEPVKNKVEGSLRLSFSMLNS